MEGHQLFTTIRCDLQLLKVPGQADIGEKLGSCPFYMLGFHRDRLLKAAIHWGWDGAIRTLEGEAGLETLDTFLRTNVSGVSDSPYRAKILVDQDGNLDIVKSPTEAVGLSNLFPTSLPVPHGQGHPDRNFEFEILIDRQATAKSEFTHFKTTHRPMYDDARQRAGILDFAEKKEVLLVNEEDGSIMEGSFTTPYFWRNGAWVTPLVPKDFDITQGSGGNDGTTRRWALENKIVIEGTIDAGSVVDGEECWISNGLRGFIHGQVKLG